MNAPVSICIRGTGAYVPEERLTNEHFESYLDTSNEWILTRTGIRERRRAAPNESTSTMAIEAARRALDDAGISAGELDLIICATATGDYPFPATATIVQNALGAGRAAGFDISAACAGFVYATATASSMIQSGLSQRALVIGAETLTRASDREDRGTAILFGDGAGAAVLTRSETPGQGILFCELGCDGSRTDNIWIPAGGSRLPTTESTAAERLHFMKMKGREVYKFAVVKMTELIDRALTATELKTEDLKLFIPHQSNLRIIESVRERLDLPMEKVAVNIDRFGNTSAASIIMALDEARRAGKLNTGDVVLLIALGAGLAWGTLIVRL